MRRFRSFSSALPVPPAFRAGRLVLACVVALACACSPGPGGGSPAADLARGAPDGGAAETAPARARIVALGDSLTAGYGLDASQAYPAYLQRRIDAAGLDYEVVNMGVSGDTTAGGLRRLEWALDGDVRILIVALGGNDGLRGLRPEDMERNLAAIVDGAQRRGIRVVLCGMEAPPNFGSAYTRGFREVFPRVAREKGTVLVPFLLEGIAGVPGLNQRDGIHPTAAGAERIAGLVWPYLEPLLQERSTR
jgi:acyl-CoA thioesterase-1